MVSLMAMRETPSVLPVFWHNAYHRLTQALNTRTREHEERGENEKNMILSKQILNGGASFCLDSPGRPHHT
jgi:hypothetical protein